MNVSIAQKVNYIRSHDFLELFDDSIYVGFYNLSSIKSKDSENHIINTLNDFFVRGIRNKSKVLVKNLVRSLIFCNIDIEKQFSIDKDKNCEVYDLAYKKLRVINKRPYQSVCLIKKNCEIINNYFMNSNLTTKEIEEYYHFSIIIQNCDKFLLARKLRMKSKARNKKEQNIKIKRRKI